jgi:hypothetical protein
MADRIADDSSTNLISQRISVGQSVGVANRSMEVADRAPDDIAEALP